MIRAVLGMGGRVVAVFAGATAGSVAGRLIAALLYGESVPPLLRSTPRTLLEQDVAPGFIGAELLGRAFGAGARGEVVAAALSAAAHAVITGPLLDDPAPSPIQRAYGESTI